MVTTEFVQHLQRPNFIVGPNGEPVAVIIDFTTWRSLLERLEAVEDIEILRSSSAELEALGQGKRPAAWKSWEEFEAELDALEAVGGLPD